MEKIVCLSIALLGLSACVVPSDEVYYEQGFAPTYVYPAEPFTSESIIIDGSPYYRHSDGGRTFYHHRR